MIAVADQRPLEELASHIGRTLGVSLEERDSSYYGTYYSDWPASELKLTMNNDPQFRDGDPPEDRYFSPAVPEAQYVLWNVENEADLAERLRASGIDAIVVDDP